MRAKVSTALAAAALVLVSIQIGLAANAADLIRRADERYRHRADPAGAEAAADLYRQALSSDPENYEAAWKLARTLCWITDHAPRDRRPAVSEEAVSAASRAVEINPGHPAGHFWLGTAYGFYGEAKGALKSLALLEPVKEEMAAVIRLDPGYEGGGAYLVLGRLYFFLPGFLGGDNRKAVDYIRTALKHGPRRWVNHLFLAEVYINEGRKREARTLLESILAGPAEPGWEPEYKEWRGEAEYWLNKLKEQKE